MTGVVEVVIEDDRWAEYTLSDLAQTACGAALVQVGLSTLRTEITVLACDDTRIAKLNADFREKDRATNVLSWPTFDLAPQSDGSAPKHLPVRDGPVDLGNIAISFDTCAREAQALGLSMTNHVTHLLVHGCLHLLGYDHISDADAALMERLEVETLARMGIPNPY